MYVVNKFVGAVTMKIKVEVSTRSNAAPMLEKLNRGEELMRSKFFESTPFNRVV